MKKIITIFTVVAVFLSAVSCGKQTTVKNTDTLSVCLASEPDSIDPALNSTADGGTLIAHLFSGLAKWTQDSEGKMVIEADAAKELSNATENPDGTVTYIYTLKDGLLWSDGKKLTANDFVYAWNRAASPSLSGDYHHLFDVIAGYDEMWKSIDKTDENGKIMLDKNGNPIQEFLNPDAKLSVTATDENSLSVTLKHAVNYWNELLAFPVFYPVRADVTENESWATEPESYVCNGPYILREWKHNSVITLTKNENYHNTETVLMPAIKFYLSDDSNNMLTNFKNGDWLFIDDVPSNEIAALKNAYPDEYRVNGQLGTYYLCWNINSDILPADSPLTGEQVLNAESEIRRALSLLLDRNYISEAVGQAGQIPASSFIAMGLTEPDGTEFYKSAGKGDGYYGYYNVSADAYETNYYTAINILKKYYDFDEETHNFTNVPVLTYVYNNGDTHQAMGEYLQGAFGAIGITVELVNQEWNTFLNTRKQGQYTLARNGWIADYNDPITFLDMWTSDSGNNDIQFGKGEHRLQKIYDLDLSGFGIDLKIENGTWNETYDRLIKEIKNCKDTEKRYELMHLAEDFLMETGCITPIFYYTDIYMINSTVSGFYSNPLGYKYFMKCTVNYDK